MKILKVIGIVAGSVITLPFVLAFVLVSLYVGFEFFGMCVNHTYTDMQTNELRSYLSDSVDDIDIVDVYSFTGNTANGNHVDSYTRMTFKAPVSENDISGVMAERYESFRLSQNENGEYSVVLCTSPPFPDNIEGH